MWLRATGYRLSRTFSQTLARVAAGVTVLAIGREFRGLKSHMQMLLTSNFRCRQNLQTLKVNCRQITMWCPMSSHSGKL